MANTIKLKDYSYIINEYTAAEDILPGSLVALDNTGKVAKHSSAGAYTEKMFAIEDELQGKEITDTYSSGSKATCWIATPGCEVNAILKAGETVVIGDLLESAGDGTLVKRTTGVAIAIALEAKDLSGLGATNENIAVRII